MSFNSGLWAPSQDTTHGPSLGAGGGETYFKVVVVNDDYLTCYRYLSGYLSDEAAMVWSADTFKVLKPRMLRALTLDGKVRTVDGIACTYNYSLLSGHADGQYRVWTGTGGPQTEVVTPRYLTDDIVVARTIAGSFITSGLIELTNPWCDCNDDGREWAQVQKAPVVELG